MAIPASGPLSMTDIQTEFGGTNPIGLNEYYAGGGLVPAGTSGTYGAVPSSGAISIQNFYGTSNVSGFLASFFTDYIPSKVVTDSSSNIYVSGTYTVNGNLTLAKFNSTGVLQWQRQYEQGGSAGDACLDNSGNIVITVRSNNTIWIVKVNPSGTLIWQRRLQGWPSGCSCVSVGPSGIACDSSGNLYVSSFVYQACLYTLSITKLDSSGNFVLARRLLSTNYRSGESQTRVAVGSDGGIYTTGGKNTGGYYAANLTKYDSSLNLVWERTLFEPCAFTSSYFTDVCTVGSSVYAVASYSPDSSRRIRTVKFDTSGNVIWQRELYSGSQSPGTGIAVSPTEDVYVTGYYLFDYLNVIAKYNSSGTLQWQRGVNISGTRRMLASSVSFSADGSPVMAIGNYNTSFADVRLLLAKIPADGSKTGTYTLDGLGYVYGTQSLSQPTATSSISTATGTNQNQSLSTSDPGNGFSVSGRNTSVVSF